MPKRVARILERRTGYPYSKLLDGTWQLYCCDGVTVPLMPQFFDVERKLADMDSAGIDVSILSLSLPGPDPLGGADADRAAREINDLLAEMIAAHPQRFWGYATLGFGDIEASIRELDRCIGALGFRGLLLFSNINGKPLDAPEFRPVFARMAELGRPIFIHPGVPLNQNYLMDLIPVPVLAFTMDTTLAAMRLALSGVLAEFPALPIIIPHVGGTIPYLMGRLDGMLSSFGKPGLPKEPSRYLKRLYMDTAVYAPEPLRWCASLMGAGRLLLGTDYPYAAWKRPVELLEQASFSEEEREQIRHGNAKRLFLA